MQILCNLIKLECCSSWVFLFVSLSVFIKDGTRTPTLDIWSCFSTKLRAHILRVHKAARVQRWPDLSTFPPACVGAPNIPLSSALHLGTLWGYGGLFNRDECAGALLPSNGRCPAHSAPLHSTLLSGCWAVIAQRWEDSVEIRRPTKPGAKGERPPHWKKLVQQMMHARQACRGRLWTGVERRACMTDATATTFPFLHSDPLMATG